MASTDRNQKLKNYHARKVRERQLQQQKENVENTLIMVDDTQPVGAVGVDTTVDDGVTRDNGPSSCTTSGNERHFKSITTATAKSRSSRSLFATTTNSNSNGGKMTMLEKKSYIRPSMGDTTDSRISMRGTTTATIPSSTTTTTYNNEVESSSVVGYGGGKKLTMGRGGGRGGGGTGTTTHLSNGGISSRVSMVPSTAPPTATTFVPPTTSLTKFPATTTKVTSNKLNNNDTHGSNNPPSTIALSTPQGGSTTELLPTISTTTTTNNASAAARMFAARRRRAQLEMSSGSGGDSTVGSGNGVNAAAVDEGAKSATATVDGDTKSATASLNGAKATTALSSSTRETSYKSNLMGRGRDGVDSIRSRGSVENMKSNYYYSGGSTSSNSGGEGGESKRTSSLATRTAYERYIGNGSGGGGGGSSASSFDGGSSSHYRASSISTSGRGSSRPSSAPVTTLSNNSGNNIGGGSARGGINTIDSTDSTDNATIASAPSADYGDRLSSTPLVSNDASSIVGSTVEVGVSGRRAGVESLTTIHEGSGSSFSSVSTIQVSNCQEKKTEVRESDNGKGDSSSDGTAVGATAKDDCNDKSAPTPILRQPHRHEIKPATNDENDGLSKSVRFALSPLERQKKVDAGVASKKVVGRVAQDDVVASNSSLSVGNALGGPPSISVSNSLEPLSSADAIQSGGDQVSSSIQKVSTPLTENDSNVDQSTPTIVQNVEAGADEEEEETDEEFTMFMNGLRREVAGDHTKVRHFCP